MGQAGQECVELAHLTDAAPPPFVPVVDGTDACLGVLHSPTNVSTMDTPPSFSAIFQGPVDMFPGFDSLEGVSVDGAWMAGESLSAEASPAAPSIPLAHSPAMLAGASPGAPVAASPAGPLKASPAMPMASPGLPCIPESSPAQTSPAQSSASPSSLGASPAATRAASWGDVDTHFCEFGYLPRADAFHAPPQLPSAAPLTSTPFAKGIGSWASSPVVVAAAGTRTDAWRPSAAVHTSDHAATQQQAADTSSSGEDRHQDETSAADTLHDHVAAPVVLLQDLSPTDEWGPATEAAAVVTQTPAATARLPADTSERHAATPAGMRPTARLTETPPAWDISPGALIRARIGIQTPFRPAEAQAPRSPYPFPAPPAARTMQTPRFVPSPHLTPNMLDAMGADSRHSGGSTWKRSVSERQAWAEMMDAVQRSARKREPPPAPDETAPERPVPRRTLRRENRSMARLDSRSAAPPQLQSLAEEPAREHWPPQNLQRSPEPWRSESPEMESLASSFSSPPSMHVADSQQHQEQPQHHGEPRMRHKRSTRQLLLDAQVTSTPTRAHRTGFAVPRSAERLSDASPQQQRTLRTLRGSASVRDFRTEYAQPRAELTLPMLAPTAPQMASPSRTMDSRRTLSEYRRSRAAPKQSDEDAFGRRTSLSMRAPTMERVPPAERGTRRMKSSLGLSGLYRQGRTSALPPQPQPLPPLASSSPPQQQQPTDRLTSEHHHIQQAVHSLESELDALRTRVAQFPL